MAFFSIRCPFFRASNVFMHNRKICSEYKRVKRSIYKSYVKELQWMYEMILEKVSSFTCCTAIWISHLVSPFATVECGFAYPTTLAHFTAVTPCDPRLLKLSNWSLIVDSLMLFYTMFVVDSTTVQPSQHTPAETRERCRQDVICHQTRNVHEVLGILFRSPTA